MSTYFEYEPKGDNYKTSAIMSGTLDDIRTACFEVEIYIRDDWYKIEVPIGLRERLKQELIDKYLEQESEKDEAV